MNAIPLIEHYAIKVMLNTLVCTNFNIAQRKLKYEVKHSYSKKISIFL